MHLGRGKSGISLSWVTILTIFFVYYQKKKVGWQKHFGSGMLWDAAVGLSWPQSLLISPTALAQA